MRKRILIVRAALASAVVAASGISGPSLAQSGYYEQRSGVPVYSEEPNQNYSYSYSESGPDYPPNRDGYGVNNNPYNAQPGDPNYADYGRRSADAARRHGTVESVEIVGERGHSSGAGAVLGGLAGGALGNQVGHGAGNTAATIGGVVGGAYLGNELERRRQRGETQRIRVRMDDGSEQVFTQDAPEIRAGDRVRVERDGHLEIG